MKSFIKSAVILLALYAQAASAENTVFNVLNSQQLLPSASVNTIAPALTLAATDDGHQLVSFAAINTIEHYDSNNLTQTHTLGLGLVKQHNPWVATQVLIQQSPFSPDQMQSKMAIKLGF